MKIADSQVALAANHAKTEITREHERLEMWQRGGPPRVLESEGGNLRPGAEAMVQRLQLSASSVSISSEARSMQIQQGELGEEEMMQGLDSKARFEIQVIKLMVEQITGRRIRLFDPSELQKQEHEAAGKGPEHAERAAPAQGSGFGLRYEYHRSHYESEKVQFSAQGVARTEDGREISFAVDLGMSREFYTETNISLRAGDALKDPLVLNFDGKAVELGERNFQFDIDLDGHQDQIAFVKSGSGFLALDRNNDGQVNDGGELFGPSTGDGFAELAEFDQDRNQWIDENDAVYDKLRIWTRDPQGNQQLLGLGAHDVGAIYLGHVATPFELNDTDNQQLGQVRTSSVFLEESGGAGTVQQIDLVV
jgi:hypothetical protein